MRLFLCSIFLASLVAASSASAQSLSSASGGDSGVPSGAVLAFATACPAGYSEYTRAAGRVIMGAGRFSQTHRGHFFSTTYNRGALGGVAYYKMNIGELPRHRHTDIGSELGDADGAPGGQGWGGGHSTGYSGFGNAFDNRPPFAVLTMCRKL